MNEKCIDKIVNVLSSLGAAFAIPATAAGAPAALTVAAIGVPLIASIAAGSQFIRSVKETNQNDCDSLLKSARQRVMEDWPLDDPTSHFEAAQRHQLEDALAEVLPTCLPDETALKHLAASNSLNGEHIAKDLLSRCNDERFAADGPRQFFLDVIGAAWEAMRQDPQFYATLQSYVDETILTEIRGVKSDTEEIKSNTDEILTLLRAQGVGDGLPIGIARDIVTAFGEQGGALDADAIAGKLKQKAEEYTSLRERLNLLSNDDPRVETLRKQAADLLETNMDAADQKLIEAERIDEAAHEELIEMANARRDSRLKTIGLRADAARLRLDYREAADLYAHGARLAEGLPDEERYEWVFKQWNSLFDRGSEFGDNDALKQAITIAETMLLSFPRERHPLLWAATQNNLGVALQTLGERESGTETLNRAVSAYENTLLEWTRERVPLDWARTQNNLGNTLRIFGERESGTETLNRAVTAFENALLEWTRERVPLDWARTQNNLGIALSLLSQREKDTETLNRAVTAFENALLESTHERVPLQWAATQNNLGNALSILGKLESGTETLYSAVTAFENALLEWTRERVPLDWAMTQNNLGSTLHTLGERESGTETLNRAVTAFEKALLEFTRQHVPLQWAKTQNNFGMALLSLGERESGTETLKRAVKAFDKALLERTRERVPLDWALTQMNRANALAIIAEREGNITAMDQAIETYDAVLAIVRPAAPAYAEIAERNKAIFIRKRALMTGGD